TVHRFQPEAEPARPKYDKRGLPRLLFLSAAVMTLVTLTILWWQLPGLWQRTWLWFRWHHPYRLEVEHLLRLPGSGPAVLVTNAPSREAVLHVLGVTDRSTVLLRVDGDADWERLTRRARRVLQHDKVLAVWSPGGNTEALERWVDLLSKDDRPAPLIPAYRD